MPTLQINTSGSWKTLLQFAPERKAEIMRGLRVFAGILGKSATWCLLHEDGKREWLPGDLGPWQPITGDQPAPLEDVLVSVYHPGEEPMVFAGYRKGRGLDDWFISGTDRERIVGEVYAWAPCLEPAARADAQQVAA